MGTLADALGREDPRLEHMLGMQAVAAHWGELPPRERQILIMDFGGGMTQTQIAQRMSISQMHVSRLRAHALGYLRARLLGPEPRPVPGLARRQHPSQPYDHDRGLRCPPFSGLRTLRIFSRSDRGPQARAGLGGGRRAWSYGSFGIS